jgi:hypothetical protein
VKIQYFIDPDFDSGATEVLKNATLTEADHTHTQIQLWYAFEDGPNQKK